MSYYDMDLVFDENVPLRDVDLYKEISDDLEPEDSIRTIDAIRKMVKDDKTFLVNRLKDYLNFDIIHLMGMNAKERYDGFRLLKLLYRIEKTGSIENRSDDFSNQKLSVLQLLKKPRLSHIPNNLTGKNEFSDFFSQLLEQLSQNITAKDANEINNAMGKIQDNWDKILRDAQKRFSLGGAAAELGRLQRYNTLPELKSLNLLILYKHRTALAACNGILNKGTNAIKSKRSEDVMRTFYLLVVSYRSQCYDQYSTIETVQKSELPSPVEAAAFQKMLKSSVPWNVLETAVAQCKSRKKAFDPDVQELIQELCAFPLFERENIDEKKIISALRYTKAPLEWLIKHKRLELDGQDTFGLDILIATIMVIAKVTDSKEKMKLDFLGNTYQTVSLASALKNPEKAAPELIELWIRKIELQSEVLYGSAEEAQLILEIEQQIFQLNKELYSYQRINDVQILYFLSVRYYLQYGFSLNLVSVFQADFISSIQMVTKADVKVAWTNQKERRVYLLMMREYYSDLPRRKELKEYIVETYNQFISDYCDAYAQQTVVIDYCEEFPFAPTYSFRIEYRFSQSRKNLISLKGFEMEQNVESIDHLTQLGLRDLYDIPLDINYFDFFPPELKKKYQQYWRQRSNQEEGTG